MHGIQACLFKYIHHCCCIPYLSQRGEDGAERGSWMPCIKIVMEITLMTMKKIMEKLWKNHRIVFLNFCGNPDYNGTTLYFRECCCFSYRVAQFICQKRPHVNMSSPGRPQQLVLFR